MKKKFINLFTFLLILVSSYFNVSAQNYAKIWANDSRAFIVVTGLEINTDNGKYEVNDLAIGEGAFVKVTDKNGITHEKKTEAFPKPFSMGGTFFTADFPVMMDSVYAISIKFKNGTEIKVEDYKLPKSWKTHHYFHSTDGTKSPASVLRKEKDKESGLWCYIYSLYPFSNYKASGGIQFDE